MNRKIRVLVLMGGKSSEHEVSIISGTEVVKSLDKKRYEVLPVIISKDGQKWRLTDKNSLLALKNPLEIKGTNKEIVLSREEYLQGMDSVSKKGIDVVFIAMHGPFGEDGTVQGMLDLAGIKYTGSGLLASSVGMDKIAFRKFMQADGIKNPKYVVIRKDTDFRNVFKALGKPPYFVKPVSQGSSVGASIVKTKKDLRGALKKAFKYEELAMVDEYLKGIEVTCSVIGNEKPVALPVIEIRPLKGEFFDYESKYTESGAEEIVPARISRVLTKKVQEISVKVYKSVGCSGFGRVDFILKNNKEPIVLEINTIQGLTPMSLFPKAAKAAGISYQELVDKIIRLALKK